MVTLNTAIRAAQIQESTISGGHLASINSPTADYVLAFDSDQDKFKWVQSNEFVINEIPDGDVDGSNKVFTLSQTPLEHSEQVFLNGLLQERGSSDDYTIVSGTITFNTAPEVGDIIMVSYLITHTTTSVTNYGYSIGGVKDPFVETSIVERIKFEFNSGTAASVGNLQSTKRNIAACNSSLHCNVFGGGVSFIERFQFPFDSGTAIRTGNLVDLPEPKGVRGLAGCNNSNYGYAMGGLSGFNYSTTINRFQFPFDSGNTVHVGNLLVSRCYIASANSSQHGYCAGGYTSSTSQGLSGVERLQFPFDSGTATQTGNLSGTRRGFGGCNSSQYMYFVGGNITGTSIKLSIIDRAQFPFDSGTAIHIGDLSETAYMTAACNSVSYGYRFGGFAYKSTIDRFQFPFNSGVASAVGTLDVARREGTAADNVDFVSMFI